MSEAWPISMDDVYAARQRIGDALCRTPLRSYPLLDEVLGFGIRALVKHENHQLTQSFKARNGLSALSALSAEQRALGVVAATRGNHGQGLAWAGARLGVPVVICVPKGNSKAKNRAMKALGAELVEEGRDYDEAVSVAMTLVADRGLTLVHSTNDRSVIAGAATMTLEMLEDRPDIEALVVSVGGGSQAVGALTVVKGLAPHVAVFGAQAARASAIHDSWQRKCAVTSESAATFADGLATKSTYAMTFPTLLAGLTGFVTVEEDEIADAVRVLFETTSSVAEGAGATGVAALRKLARSLEGKTVGVVISGGNIDADAFSTILRGGVPHVG